LASISLNIMEMLTDSCRLICLRRYGIISGRSTIPRLSTFKCIRVHSRPYCRCYSRFFILSTTRHPAIVLFGRSLVVVMVDSKHQFLAFWMENSTYHWIFMLSRQLLVFFLSCSSSKLDLFVQCHFPP
jgi:hypothetical protein